MRKLIKNGLKDSYNTNLQRRIFMDVSLTILAIEHSDGQQTANKTSGNVFKILIQHLFENETFYSNSGIL